MDKKHDYYIGGVHSCRMMLERFPRHVLCCYVDQSMNIEGLKNWVQYTQEAGVALKKTTTHTLDAMLPDVPSQGVVMAVKQLPTLGLEDAISRAEKSARTPLVLILDKIQDPRNLGACIRTAAVFGVDCIVIAKHKASPLNATAIKVASGAACLVPVVSMNISRAIDILKSADFWVYAAAEGGSFRVAQLSKHTAHAWVLGHEGSGVSPAVLKKCDQIYSIDASIDFSTLNVSVATGVCLYESRR